MATPSISSQQLSTYSITIEEDTKVSATVTDADQVTAYFVENNTNAILTNTSGNTWEKYVRGYTIGVGAAMTVRFVATNSDPDSDVADAGSTLTVSSPTRPKPVEKRIAERIFEKFEEMDTTNENFGMVQGLTYAPPKAEDWNDPKKFPFCWARFLQATPEFKVSGTKNLWFNPLIIDYEFHRFETETSDFDWFFEVRESFTRMMQRDPHLELSSETFIVEDFRIGTIQYPGRSGNVFEMRMVIPIAVKVTLENI